MSISNFVPRHVIALQPETGFARPSELPEMVRLDSPALDVMTDFTVVRPVTVGAGVSIDRALEGMKKAGWWSMRPGTSLVWSRPMTCKVTNRSG
jgi:hypothetical protein